MAQRKIKNKMYRSVGYGHVFSDPKIKKEMLSLRKQGLSFPEIAALYHVDHSTIVYHCQNAGISPDRKNKKIIIPKTIIAKQEILEKIRKDGPMMKIDERGVKWVREKPWGEWICFGKTGKQKKIEESNKKKKELESKRLKMLLY